MTEDRDPHLQSLFAEAGDTPDEAPFTAEIMARVDRIRRRNRIGRIGLGAAAVLILWLLSFPVQEAVWLMTQAITFPLIDLGHGLFAALFSPLNTFASLFAIGLIAFRIFRRRFFAG